MKFQRYLNEKFFTAYQVKGNTEEVFVNPSKQEFKELERAVRDSIGAIMDIKTKQIYMFSRDNLIHSQAWRKFKPDGENRQLYYTDTLLSAEFDWAYMEWNLNSQEAFSSDKTIQGIQKKNWSFFKKWIPTIEKDVMAMKQKGNAEGWG